MSRFLRDHERILQGHPRLRAALLLAFVGLLVGALGSVGTMAATLTVNVQGGDGTPVTNFRFLVEEDAMYNVVPGETCQDALSMADCLSVQFHKSYMPVVAEGRSDGSPGSNSIEVEAGKRYYVSILPDEGYTIGGGRVEIDALATAGTLSVTVQPQPIPTAQIRIFAFLDNNPTNNAPDAGEIGLGPWQILVEDAGGRYGASAGQMIMDAFGNPLGTSYTIDNTATECVTGDPSTGDCSVILSRGNGSPMTGATDPSNPFAGIAAIKNLNPGKFGIQIVPPATAECPAGWVGPGTWQQTTTIEGKKVIDAWVKAGEPPFFSEFGPPGPHVFIGFVQDCYDPNEVALETGADITGTVRSIHNSRPPNFAFNPGAAVPSCWVSLNQGPAGGGTSVFAGPCDGESNFSIPGVPVGLYNLTLWDGNLDYVIANQQIEVTQADADAGALALGDVSIFAWFARLENWIFYDADADGFRDPGEVGIPEQGVNLRWRDGTVYQAFPTDLTGYVPFDEIFPFFSWLVAEVDFVRFKATGATIVVDAGGLVDPTGETEPTSLADWDCPNPTDGDGDGFADDCPLGRGVLNPQPQFCTAEDIALGTLADIGPDGLEGTADDITCATTADALINPNTGNNYSRTETGVVLTEAFQGFLGQTSVIEWGKAPYGRGENGGISGIVFYAVTRAEDDPRYAGAEVWEPGIPRIQVALYWDLDRDGQIDDVDGDGCSTPSDVDNYPFGNFPGPEDFDYTLDTAATEPCSFIEDASGTGTFSAGDAIQITSTDSWDDSQPTSCQGDVFYACPEGALPDCADTGISGFPEAERQAVATDCFDGMRNYNQVRPGTFDGGYAFETFIPGGVDTGAAEETLTSGTYIVGTGAHRVYRTVKEEDRNVDFGDEYLPETMLLPPTCAGDLRIVPAQMSLFPEPVPFGGQERPLCDRKQIKLSSGLNAAVDFFMFTEVPIAGHVVGGILNDLANEFDPNAPTFGEKYSPPYLPVSIQDFTGTEVGRTYSDRWGRFNALLPSTWTNNLGIPSGMSPNMLTTCMNSPFKPNPAWDGTANTPQFIQDEFYQKQFSQFCYVFQYMPGTTTYLDTPVVPVAAFAGPNNFPLDCELPEGTPVIEAANSGGPVAGPYLSLQTPTRYQGFIITSARNVMVPNPRFGEEGQPKLITRDYGFGGGNPANRKVYLNDIEIEWDKWNPNRIEVDSFETALLGGATSAQLRVVRSDNGQETTVGMTIHLAPADGTIETNIHQVLPGGSIQAAIDAANPGDLILVAPGLYQEMVIMHKPVRLQGWGAGSTFINAVNTPAEKLDDWRAKIRELLGMTPPAFDLLPAQEAIAAAIPGAEPDALFTEEGAGILVVGRSGGPNRFRNFDTRIDGFGITGSANGGGIVVNGYAQGLELSNNKLYSNYGVYGGGIRIGHPFLQLEANDGLTWQDGVNDDVAIHHNQIIENGGGTGVGGGVSMCHGADRYAVTQNWVCGNFNQGHGGGIGHLGRSHNALIADNTIIFNQNFNQGLTVSGGGIYVGGAAPIGGDALTIGSGTVTIESNLILGNNAGAGNGAGIALQSVNGQDVENSSDNPGPWYLARIFNNFIANNVAGFAGGGISLQDVAKANIDQNTIANNDSTATAGPAFETGNPNLSIPQIAGIASHAHSPALDGAIGAVSNIYRRTSFSNPRLDNNVIRDNRSFYFEVLDRDATNNPISFGLRPDVGAGEPVVYDDLGIIGGAAGDLLRPRNSVLRTEHSGTYLASNEYSDADLFAAGYFNGARGSSVNQQELTTIGAQPAFDEGGNFIEVRYGPLTLDDQNDGIVDADYHLSDCAVAAVNIGRTQLCGTGSPFYCEDIDGDARDADGGPDAGADEIPGCALVANAFPNRANGGATTGAGGTDPGTTTDQTAGRDTLAGQAAGADGNPPIDGGATQLDPGDGATTGTNLTIEPHAVSQLQRGPVACATQQHFLDRYPSINGAFGPNGGPAKCMTVTGSDGFSRMADGEVLYSFGFRDVTGLTGQDLYDEGFIGAEFPAPTIVLNQNEEFYLELSNVGMAIRPDLFDPHTVHFHGHPNASSVFDGLPESGVSVNMNATLTYYYNIKKPGTYMYHCHVEATEHMQMGMLGNLYVRPAQDECLLNGTVCPPEHQSGDRYAYNDGDGSTGYDVDFPIQLWSFDSAYHIASETVQPLPFALMRDDYGMINGRGYPDTVKEFELTNASVPPDHLGGVKNTQRVHSVVRAEAGQRVLLRISNLNVTNFYTLRSLGIPMQVVGQDARLRRGPDGKDLYYGTSSITIGGGEAMDVMLDTTGIEPGTYFLYSTNLNFLTNKDEDLGGIMTEIVITQPAP